MKYKSVVVIFSSDERVFKHDISGAMAVEGFKKVCRPNALEVCYYSDGTDQEDEQKIMEVPGAKQCVWKTFDESTSRRFIGSHAPW